MFRPNKPSSGWQEWKMIYALLSAIFFFIGATAPSGPGPPHYRGFTITFRHTTLGRTPLDEWSARRRDLYLTTHNTHNGHTSMSPAGFEPAIPASEQLQTLALGSALKVNWYLSLLHLFKYIIYDTVDLNNYILQCWGLDLENSLKIVLEAKN
jgi:hypothetical protein